jgi:predicted ribonuclease toxin of YeeF-YezG toxin-antitoxin module
MMLPLKQINKPRPRVKELSYEQVKIRTAYAKLSGPEFEMHTLSDGTTVKRLKPNFEYESNGYKYKTDAQGRIIQVEGQLQNQKGGRSPYSQRTVGNGDGRLPGDQGGHLIGDQFGGAGGKENLVPMDAGVNNYHKGKWGQMEKRWAGEIEKGNTVDVKIEPQYSDGTNRPSHFKIKETINGETNSITIRNVSP